MTPLSTGLAEWVRKPGPSKVLDAVRQRARRGHRTEAGSLSGVRLAQDERRDVALLLGTRWELSGRPVRLQDLTGQLAEHGLTVRELVEVVDGVPIEDDRTVRQALAAAAQAEIDEAVGLLARCGIAESDVSAWRIDAGLPRPGSGELAALAKQVSRVWPELPRGNRRPVRLAQVAADIHNNAHALDFDEPLGRAVVRLAAVVNGLERPRRQGKAWRNAWSAVGVRCDGVSSRVLVLNLPLTGDAPASRICSASVGEPVWLTLRSLNGHWGVPAGIQVFVCENVTVVEAAADEISMSCPPMVCTDGTASGAALDLINGLADAGCEIHFRADFDRGGFIIADQIRSVAPDALPWRFDTGSYHEALDVRYSLSTPTATVDDDLALLRADYAERRIPVHEERILGTLLADLRTSQRSPGPL